MPTATKPSKPLFPLGRVVATQGATQDRIVACIRRHVTGDWGVLDAEDRQANDEALGIDARLLSAYPIDPEQPCKGDNRIWIITEASREVTTALLPDEY